MLTFCGQGQSAQSAQSVQGVQGVQDKVAAAADHGADRRPAAASRFIWGVKIGYHNSYILNIDYKLWSHRA